MRACLRQLEKQLVRVVVPDLSAEYVMLRQDLEKLGGTVMDGPPVVNLLPALDPYLMAYRDRTRYLAEAFYNHVYDSTGNAAASVLVDGRITGIWDIEEGDDPLVKLFFFEMLPEAILNEVYVKRKEWGCSFWGRSRRYEPAAI